MQILQSSVLIARSAFDLGPSGANIFTPRKWGQHTQATTNNITLEVTRVVLALGIFAIGVGKQSGHHISFQRRLHIVVSFRRTPEGVHMSALEKFALERCTCHGVGMVCVRRYDCWKGPLHSTASMLILVFTVPRPHRRHVPRP